MQYRKRSSYLISIYPHLIHVLLAKVLHVVSHGKCHGWNPWFNHVKALPPENDGTCYGKPLYLEAKWWFCLGRCPWNQSIAVEDNPWDTDVCQTSDQSEIRLIPLFRWLAWPTSIRGFKKGTEPTGSNWFKDVGTKPHVRPHPKNTPKQYRILVIRGGMKTLAVRRDFDCCFVGFRI